MCEQPNDYLLLGAGFSRNWGGWLANEAFEYLLGCPEVDEPLRHLLWTNKDKGFEEVLAILQAEDAHRGSASGDQRLRKLEEALSRMFEDMNKAFENIQFDPAKKLCSYLFAFKAIFTLNQDTLLESHFFSPFHLGRSQERWAGWTLPGMESRADRSGYVPNPGPDLWTPTEERPLVVLPDCQPYFKLHGSSNWRTGNENRLLVLGGNKTTTINRYPVLKWYHEEFAKALAHDDARLVIIGYSFGDDHINAVLQNAVAKGRLQIFVVDPNGVDSMDKNHALRARGSVYRPGALAEVLWPRVKGASRRPLRNTFSDDDAEYHKLTRFLSRS